MKWIYYLLLIVVLFLQSCDKATEPDNTPPSISITFPINGGIYNIGEPLNITAEATDNRDVLKVQFFINGDVEHTDYESPFEYEWDTSNLSAGLYGIYCKAFDEAENSSISENISINLLPSIPFNPIPQNNETNSSISPLLQWNFNGNNNDILFDLYFGDSISPPLFVSDLENSEYQMEDLDNNVTYYWKIVVKSNNENTVGPIWLFNTENNVSIYIQTQEDTYLDDINDMGSRCYSSIHISSDETFNVLTHAGGGGFIISPLSPEIGGNQILYSNDHIVLYKGGNTLAFINTSYSIVNEYNVSDNYSKFASSIYSDYIYCGSYGSSTHYFKILDVTDVNNPVEKGVLSVPNCGAYGYKRLFQVSDDYVYGVYKELDTFTYTRIIDVSDKDNPEIVHTEFVPFWDLYRTGDYILTNIGVYDCSDLSNPVQLNDFAFGETIYTDNDNYVVDSYNDTVRLINISDILNPVVSATVDCDAENISRYIRNNFDNSAVVTCGNLIRVIKWSGI